MGPEEQVHQLYAELCNRWPRCKDNPVPSDPRPEAAFLTLVSTCKDWMGEKGLNEIPSLFVHLAGADGEKQVLELTAWSYIIETKGYGGRDTCAPLFGVW